MTTDVDPTQNAMQKRVLTARLAAGSASPTPPQPAKDAVRAWVGVKSQVSSKHNQTIQFPSQLSWLKIFYGQFVGSSAAALARGILYAAAAAAFPAAIAQLTGHPPSGQVGAAEAVIGIWLLRGAEGIVLDKWMSGWKQS